MNHLVVLPLWEHLVELFIVAASGAYFGGRLAIMTCSSQQGCAMRVTKERKQVTQNLEEQLAAMHLAHPEFQANREAANRVLEDTGEHPAVPPKRRAQQDKDRDGQG